MFEKKQKGMALGAVMGSVLGSLSALVSKHPDQAISKGKEWLDKAKDLGDTVLKEVKHYREPEDHHTTPFVAGALMGLLLGAGSALLLSPKTGKQLRDKLTKQYGDIIDKANDMISHAEPKTPIKKTIKKKAAALSKTVSAKKNAVKKTISRVKKKL